MIVDVKSLSLEEMVYSRLEEEILSGELASGCALGEIALAKRLGVSRTPIRSAIHRLAEEGLVEVVPNKGATVIGINTADLVDIYKIREDLRVLRPLSLHSALRMRSLMSLAKRWSLPSFI